MNHIKRWCEDSRAHSVVALPDGITLAVQYPRTFWNEVRGDLEALFELYIVRDLTLTQYGVRATIANGILQQEKSVQAFWIYCAPEEGREEAVALQVKAGKYTHCPGTFSSLRRLIQEHIGLPKGQWVFQKS